MSSSSTAVQRTMLPWVAEGSRIVSEGARNLTIARVGVAADGDYSPANAAFIVRACNVHEQLVAALREAEAFMAGFEGDDMQEGIDAKLEQMRAALIAAEA